MGRRLAPLFAAVALCSVTLAVGASGAPAAAPTIPLRTISHATTSSVVLEADINPQGKATAYHFEYGPADCASGPCERVPGKDAVIPAGGGPVRVSVEVKGLSPRATYHFRVVAKSVEGEIKSPDGIFMAYLPPQEFGSCPNERFRSANPARGRIEYSSANLPDCRAYEQATPVDKGAGDATGTVAFVKAALSGAAISFLSVSGVPGGVGSQELPSYLAARGENGWTSNGMLPPATLGQRANVIGWAPNFEDIYTEVSRLGEPLQTAFLDSRGAGAEPTKITPYTPGLRPRFAAASEGGKEALFEARSAIPSVAGAIPGKSNVYLWERESKTLSLAGVLNDGTAPPAGAFAGSYDWLRGTNQETLRVGGADRRYYTQAQHAIAANGSAIYFTAAGSGQLYERLNPTEPQSTVNGEGKCIDAARACTVRISASRRSVPDPAGTRPAAFMGASADGLNAFFTSTEMLTDDSKTGPEQEAAEIERADIDGGNVDSNCLPVHALGMAVDSKHVYWADPTNGTIGRADLNCDESDNAFITVPQIESESEPGVLVPAVPQYVAVDGGRIYWSNDAAQELPAKFPATEGGTIGRAKLNGDGAASEIEVSFIAKDVETGEGLSAPQGIAVDGSHIYWANPQDSDKSIGRADLDGNNTELHFRQLTIGEIPEGLAVDSTHLYYVTHEVGGSDLIVRLDLEGPPEKKLAGSGPGSDPRGVAVDGGHVYWARSAEGTIARASLDLESEVEWEWIEGAGHPVGLAVDGSHVYWSSNGEAPSNPGNDLYRYDAMTETLTDLTPDSAEANGAEVRGVLGTSEDGSYVYFAANGVPEGVNGSPNGRGEVAEPGNCPGGQGESGNGTCNLYLAHGGTIEFIARLQAGGGNTDASNWSPSGGDTSGDFQITSRVTPDGQTLLFRSRRQLTNYRNEGTPELYLHRAGGSGVSCVSCNPTGMAAAGGVNFFGGISPSAVIPPRPNSVLGHNLSSDGNRVFFETIDALVGADINGDAGCPPVGAELQEFPACTDTYMWEAQGTGTCDATHAVADGGCQYLVSTGKGTEPALLADASGDGNDVFFFSRSRLVGQDEDALVDIYDARVGGGLGAQNQAPSNPCESAGACHPPGIQPPEISSPPSGPGNPKVKKRPCAKGKHRVKNRCIAKHKKAGRQPGRKVHSKGGKGR